MSKKAKEQAAKQAKERKNIRDVKVQIKARREQLYKNVEIQLEDELEWDVSSIKGVKFFGEAAE